MPHCVAVQRRSWGRYFAALKKLQKQCPEWFWLFLVEMSRNFFDDGYKRWESTVLRASTAENRRRWGWSGVSGRGSSLHDLFSPFLLSGVVDVHIRTALQSSPCSAVYKHCSWKFSFVLHRNLRIYWISIDLISAFQCGRFAVNSLYVAVEIIFIFLHIG